VGAAVGGAVGGAVGTEVWLGVIEIMISFGGLLFLRKWGCVAGDVTPADMQ